MNSTGELSSATLYQTNGNFRDDMFAGRVTGGYFIYLTVSGTSTFGIDESISQKEVQYYPNPSSGNINIGIAQGGKYQIDVINTLGQVVHSENVVISGNEVLRRDFSKFNSGIYLINISGEGYTNSSKITISR